MSDPIRVPGSQQTRPGSFLGPEQRASAWKRLGSEQFDVVVIGGGPGGYNCAIRLGQLGFASVGRDLHVLVLVLEQLESVAEVGDVRPRRPRRHLDR